METVENLIVMVSVIVVAMIVLTVTIIKKER
jgi:hypothetical protein